MKIQLTSLTDDQTPVGISMTVESVTWPELLNAFVAFLNAAGYSIDRDNIADWLDEAAETLPRKTARR